ncbi:MAG: mechanosensitive ion channel family protein [Pseudomonadota bacterium]|nr:mechanosensitive ion channel family protein [Pseudomonadota bacterium]
MTNNARGAAEAAAMPVRLQLERLWGDIWIWLSGNSGKILAALLVAALIVLLLLGLRAFGKRLCRSDPQHTHWRTTIGKVLAKTKLWFMAALALRLVAGYASAPEPIMGTITFLFVVAAVLQVAIWVRELILGIVERRAGSDHDASGFGSAVGIIRLLVTVAIFAIAVIVILDNLGVNVTGLVAGLGIGGIAIGLAAQGIFADLFAALSIIFDKPFRRGDAVRWDTTSGTVEKIGLKSTRVRALTGEEVVISNTNLLNKELYNMARLPRRRIVQPFGIVYQTAPETCARVTEIVGAIVDANKQCRLVRCGMIGFGASSLDYELQFDVMSEDYEQVFAARSQVLIAILDSFNAHGIQFAYPTQTSYTAAPDGTFVLPYAAAVNVPGET